MLEYVSFSELLLTRSCIGDKLVVNCRRDSSSTQSLFLQLFGEAMELCSDLDTTNVKDAIILGCSCLLCSCLKHV